MKPRKSPRRTVGATYVNFPGETKEIRVLALKDAGAGMYEPKAVGIY